MKRYLVKQIVVIISLSLIGSLGIAFFLLNYYTQTISTEVTIIAPASYWKTFVFISKSLAIVTPLLGTFTLLVSYLISENWGKQVTIKTQPIETSINTSKKSIKLMSEDEKYLFKIITSIEGNIYQNDITRESGFKKYKVSRILKRFENYGIIERERYGMTNLIQLTLSEKQVE